MAFSLSLFPQWPWKSWRPQGEKKDAHMSHELTYRGPLGFLDRLPHVVTLLLSGINREDGQLVELDEVKKRWPETNMRALV